MEQTLNWILFWPESSLSLSVWSSELLTPYEPAWACSPRSFLDVPQSMKMTNGAWALLVDCEKLLIITYYDVRNSSMSTCSYWKLSFHPSVDVLVATWCHFTHMCKSHLTFHFTGENSFHFPSYLLQHFSPVNMSKLPFSWCHQTGSQTFDISSHLHTWYFTMQYCHDYHLCSVFCVLWDQMLFYYAPAHMTPHSAALPIFHCVPRFSWMSFGLC